MRLKTNRLFEDAQLAVLAGTIALALIGVALIYSASVGSRFTEISNHGFRQAGWLGIALLAMLAAITIPFTLYDGLRAYVLWGLSLLLLVLVLLIGTSGLGAQRWLVVGGLRIQPSELAKLLTVIALARYLAGRRRNPRSVRTIIVAGLIAMVPMLLVLRQPDLGTSLVFPAILVPMLWWAGLPFLYLVLLVSPAVSMVAGVNPWAWGIFALCFIATVNWCFFRYKLSWIFVLLVTLVNLGVGIATPKIWGSMPVYQQQRITAFLNPMADRFGSGYQLIQSQIAVGSGGLFGQGYLHGTQKNFQFLPEKHTDFVYSVAGEEWGLIGAAIILLLYFVVITGCVDIAQRARSRFASLVVVGIGAMFLCHVVVNIGMTIGFAPVTGLPLPLLSYGGSSLLTSMAALGIVVGIGVRRHEY